MAAAAADMAAAAADMAAAAADMADVAGAVAADVAEAVGAFGELRGENSYAVALGHTSRNPAASVIPEWRRHPFRPPIFSAAIAVWIAATRAGSRPQSRCPPSRSAPTVRTN